VAGVHRSRCGLRQPEKPVVCAGLRWLPVAGRDTRRAAAFRCLGALRASNGVEASWEACLRRVPDRTVRRSRVGNSSPPFLTSPLEPRRADHVRQQLIGRVCQKTRLDRRSADRDNKLSRPDSLTHLAAIATQIRSSAGGMCTTNFAADRTTPTDTRPKRRSDEATNSARLEYVFSTSKTPAQHVHAPNRTADP
jgi:hypothetical protein